MTFWTGIIIAAIFLAVTIVIFATKLFFPYHRIVALVVYAIGWVPFLYSISLRKHWILKHQEAVNSFFQVFWIHIVFGVFMLLSIYVLLTLFPPIKSPFIGLSNEEIVQTLEEDRTIILFLDKQLDSLLREAEEKGSFSADFSKITGGEKKELESFWLSFIETMLELDLLKQRYESFYQLSPVTKIDLHRQAFENGYAAFLTQHYYALQLAKNLENQHIKTFLNQNFPAQGVNEGTFDLIRGKLTDADELLRLNTGRAYYRLIRTDDAGLDKLIARQLEGVDESIASYANLLAKKPLNFLERNSFKLWFPIQKKSAKQISYIKAASRDYHIQPEFISQYRDKILPGDILLERREWHATNVGIPGYWTHAALYIGTLNEMNVYFKEVPELKGRSFEEFLKESYANVYEKMLQADENGHEYAVIEAKRPGVIITSLEYTANADSFAVLRVKDTSASGHFKIVTQALDYFGKPYDFDFNFVTDTALVCSELVYKAYQDIPQLSLELKEMNGRPILSPNQFAEKYAQEFENENSELELILFLDGNEKTGAVTEKGSEDFKETWRRPKWHIAKDFINFQ